MRSNIFKLSTITSVILMSTSASAALYRVVEVDAPALKTVVDRPVIHGSHGSAIQVSAPNVSCFSSDCSDGNAYKLAGDIVEAPTGFSYRQEVPFGVDNHFIYNDLTDLENYCNSQLKYSTCNENWAFDAWWGIKENNVGGLYRERQAWNITTSYPENASGFIESTSTIETPDSPMVPVGGTTVTANSKNVVINAFDGDNVIGSTSSGYYSIGSSKNAIMYRNRGFYRVNDTDTSLLLPRQNSDGADKIVEEMGRSMAFDSFDYNGNKYVVGSAAVAPYDYKDSDKDTLGDVGNCPGYTSSSTVNESNAAANKECQSFAFALKPFVWDMGVIAGPFNKTVTGVPVSLWSGIGDANGNDTLSSANQDEASAIAGVRAAVVPSSGTYSGKPVLVGLNTFRYNSSNLLMQAAVFYPKASVDPFVVGEHNWESKFITDATVRIGSDYIYSNTIAKDVNENLLVIGESKRRGDKPKSGAANNRLFIADASNGAPTANYFSGGIFFSGAGGEANSINNKNEIVGKIDAETNREVSGKKRRQRAFIYPYNGTGTDQTRRAIFNNQAWWIDDLTNGGTYSSNNNKYRVINASDINDAGVISATALKCTSSSSSSVAVEYQSTSHNAYCGSNGNGFEKIVAIKLVPINGAESTDIEKRSADKETVSRSGAGFGWICLTLLSLISFRRYR